MRPIDPRFYLADTNVQPSILTFEVNLVTAEQVGTRRRIGVLRPERNTVFIVKAIVPFARQRINITNPATESIQMISPQQANMCFNFECLINGKPAAQTRTRTDPVSNLASAAVETLLTDTAGIPFISADPYTDAIGSWFNPLMSVPVLNSNPMELLFSLLPPPSVSALPAAGQFQIGGADTVARRVDYAGVVIVGQTLSKDYYDGAQGDVANVGGA